MLSDETLGSPVQVLPKQVYVVGARSLVKVNPLQMFLFNVRLMPKVGSRLVPRPFGSLQSDNSLKGKCLVPTLFQERCQKTPTSITEKINKQNDRKTKNRNLSGLLIRERYSLLCWGRERRVKKFLGKERIFWRSLLRPEVGEG